MSTPLYSAINNSPVTTLAQTIAADATQIELVKIAALPAAPNIVTIGTDESAELVLYTAVSGNRLTGCTRGFNGTTPRAWTAGTIAYRAYTAYDHDTFKKCIEEHQERIGQLTEEIGALTQGGTVVKTEKLEFDTYVANGSMNLTTGSYTPTTAKTVQHVRKKNSLDGGTISVNWDTNKINRFRVRFYLFDESGKLSKQFCGTNGAVTSPYYQKVIGELGEDAWLDVGTKGDSLVVSGPFTLPLPANHKVLCEIIIASADTVYPDGTLTSTWTKEAEANNTWSTVWITTGVEVSVIVEERVSNFDGVVYYTEQELTDEQKAQARKNIGFTTAPFDYKQCGLPILYLTGDTTGMTKDDAVTLQYNYDGTAGTVEVKWQGSSSVKYAKKNYTMKFDNAFEAKEGWGAQKKYCFKANWIDASHARNVVSAKLWGQIVRSRTTVPEDLDALPNCGAIDGFPCIIVLNDEFHGLYTWNIPKDGWMLGMGSGANEAIFCAEGNGGESGPESFKQTVITIGTGFGLEYAPDEDNSQWAVDSLNTLITACINATPTSPDASLDSLIDWDSAIDHFIFVGIMQGSDNVRKNYLMYTKDGTKWGFTPYDMDGTWGMKWDGKSWEKPSKWKYKYLYDAHRLYNIIRWGKEDAFKARYTELRNTVLSEENVLDMFLSFICTIPAPVYAAERDRWPGIPSTSVDAIAQIMNYYRMRVAVLDAEVAAM